jgi:hypothetical protein
MVSEILIHKLRYMKHNMEEKVQEIGHPLDEKSRETFVS